MTEPEAKPRKLVVEWGHNQRVEFDHDEWIRYTIEDGHLYVYVVKHEEVQVMAPGMWKRVATWVVEP